MLKKYVYNAFKVFTKADFDYCYLNVCHNCFQPQTSVTLVQFKCQETTHYIISAKLQHKFKLE